MRVLLALVIVLACWSGAKAQSQALLPGDGIAISVFQDPKLDKQMIIGPTGFISFPLVGQIKAAGMTPAGLAQLLKSRLQDKYTTPLDITVALISLGAENAELKPRFYITGEVKKPGAYPIRTKITVMQAIAMAGGLDLFAAQNRIQVRRKINGVESIFKFDYTAFENGTNLNDNIQLRQDDVIIVPERGLFD